MGWSTRLVKLVRERLMHDVGRDFERQALPWVRAVWPNLVPERSLGAVDCSGIDASAGLDRTVIPVVVQFKGFRVSDEELGARQLADCSKSVRAFEKSGYCAKRYVFIHNRSGRNREFSTKLEVIVGMLVRGNRAAQVEIWDLKQLTDHAMTSLLARFTKFVSQLPPSIVQSSLLPFDEPLTSVPFVVDTIRAETTRLLLASVQKEARRGDPLDTICGPGTPRITVVLGEFGFGKSTLLRRLASSTTRLIVFAHGALLDADPKSAKQFLAGCLRREVEAFLQEEIGEADRQAIRRVLPVVVDRTLKREDPIGLVVIDALDESEALERPGGGQQLFNSLRDMRTKIVLGMRTEFWQRKELTFATAFGEMPRASRGSAMRIQRIELTEWGTEELLKYVERYKHKLTAAATARIDSFAALVRAGEYERLFGDIPRRPMFLSFILDSIREDGLPAHRVNRAELLMEWAKRKVARDIEAPIATGGRGRVPLASRQLGLEESVKMSMMLMRKAARCMSYIENEEMLQRGWCRLDDVRRSTPELGDLGSDLGVLLNSLLQEAEDSALRGLSVRFAHRMFEDFFLAWDLLLDCRSSVGFRVPKDVAEWCTAMQEMERQ